MDCMYCGDDDDDTEMLVVGVTTKPVGTPNRWERLGYCCVACHTAGAELDYDRSEPPMTRIKLKPGRNFPGGHLLQNVHHNTWYEVYNPRSPYRYIVVGGKEIILTKTAIKTYFNKEES